MVQWLAPQLLDHYAEHATEGPYRHIRHPSYLGMLLALVGWVLVFRSGFGLVVSALAMLVLSKRGDVVEQAPCGNRSDPSS